MPLQIVQRDITRMRVDAIVNAAKNSLTGGGGVDGCIHRAAGPLLLEECITLGGCETGDAKITRGYDLPCRYVIHTVGPVYQDGDHGERELLASCYRRSLELAVEHECQTVAFPLISSGVYGYPKAEAFRVATETIVEFLRERDTDLTVYLVLTEHSRLLINYPIWAQLRSYIAENYVRLGKPVQPLFDEGDREETVLACEAPGAPCEARAMPPRKKQLPATEKCAAPIREATLDSLVRNLDESFSQMLLRKIDEKHMTDVECYKRANIDRKLFSKIRGDVSYRPRKSTVLAFAIALELSLPETEELLKKAGYALSHSNEFDLIIEYFIRRGIYDIYVINEALFSFDQSLLGA